MTNYNHAFDFAFSVMSEDSEGEVPGMVLRRAIEKRLMELDNQELEEACGLPYDTFKTDEAPSNYNRLQEGFIVTWTIDLSLEDAKTPEEAARYCREVLMDQSNIASIFSVEDKKGNTTVVDALELDGD